MINNIIRLAALAGIAFGLLGGWAGRTVGAEPGDTAIADLLAGKFRWVSTGPLIAPANGDNAVSIKDPTVVFDGGRWHIYATIRTADKPANMEYLAFADWDRANAAPRHVISLDQTYHCAPQVFYFRPQKKWYLIYQWRDRTPETGFFGPAYSTIDDVGKPETLTRPKMFFDRNLGSPWIDFWVICDDTHAYLFFTGDDGRFWRSSTAIGDFPRGFSPPQMILQQPKNEFFEAAHTYRLKGMQKYLTIVEAIGPGNRRYYKAYVADRLDGTWQAIAGTWNHPFASINNVSFAPGVKPWTDSISHGELLRDGVDETLTVDPANLRLLYQGCSAQERAGKGYGMYPWRLGILQPANQARR